jgi:hypothetical protein
MSFHLEGPWLSTTGKRKGKQKFRSAEEARRSRELAELWSQRQRDWAEMAPRFSNKKIDSQSKLINDIPRYTAPPGRESQRIPSLPFTAGPCVKSEQNVYTGDAVLGISTLHKSNAVPVFSKDEAVSIAKMRR